LTKQVLELTFIHSLASTNFLVVKQ